MDKHHGHGHHHHHTTESSTQSTSFTTIPTVASTLVQTILTTVMSNESHHNRHIHHEHNLSDHFADSNLIDSASESSNVGDSSVHFSGSHNHHADAGGHDMGPMYFHFDVNAIILFKEWDISTSQGLIMSVIGIFLMGLLYEGIKFLREHMFKKYFTSLEYSSVSVLGDDGRTITEVHKVARNRMFSRPHLLQTILHVIQMVLSYFLMLIFMTYNVWLCLGVVFGAGAGYFLFGWKKATVVDITEHCH